MCNAQDSSVMYDDKITHIEHLRETLSRTTTEVIEDFENERPPYVLSTSKKQPFNPEKLYNWYHARYVRKDDYGKSVFQILRIDYFHIRNIASRMKGNRKFKDEGGSPKNTYYMPINEYNNNYYVAIKECEGDVKTSMIKLWFKPYDFKGKVGLSVGLEGVITDPLLDRKNDPISEFHYNTKVYEL